MESTNEKKGVCTFPRSCFRVLWCLFRQMFGAMCPLFPL